MTDLRRTLNQFSKGGSIIYATIENISNGLATVLLVGSNQRLTNLPIVDIELEVGDRVLVDYSSGTPPLVKRILKEEPLPEDLELAEASEKDNEGYMGGIGFAYTSTSDIQISSNSWNTIVLTNSLWDDANFLTNGKYIIPQDGAYFLVANLALSGLDVSWLNTTSYSAFKAHVTSHDTEYMLAKLSGSVFGTIAIDQEYGFDSDPNIITTLSISGLLFGTEGEEILLQVKPVSNNSSITLNAYNQIMPKFSCQRIDINSGELAAVQAIMGEL